MKLSDSTHRQNFIDEFSNNIESKSEDTNLTFADAAVRVALDWLGYDADDDSCIDSADRGIDAWFFSESVDPGLDIFQVKTHKPGPNGQLCLDAFDVAGINDLRRAKDFLLHHDDSDTRNSKLQVLIKQWKNVTHERKTKETETPMQVTLNLVIVGEALTAQAQQEFDAFSRSNIQVVTLPIGVAVQFHAVLYTIDHILDRRWREKNNEWRDLSGQKKDQIELTPLNDQFISDNKNAIFYCKAIDLVNAYNSLGYQLFEPNVRAEIRTSRVNRAIRESVMFEKTRKDFRFLNNGVTITCSSYSTPKNQRQSFLVKHPGVINGLQTVVALHSAYESLSIVDKKDFENQCSVLVRLLNSNAVDEITDVVKATNNQNPMEPRNLVSNNVEQVIFVHAFAEKLGWFYGAKQGAWDAFRNDHRRWRPRLSQRPSDFQPADKRKRVRRIDNHDLAQEWMSFIGFAPIAVNQRKSLFDDRYYTLIFKSRTRSHGYDYGFEMKRAVDSAINQSPEPGLMLVSHLAYEFVRQITLSPQEYRREACDRLGLDPKLPKLELEVELNKDSKFMLNQALNSMSYLFVEYIGFVLFRTFGENLHAQGSKILANHSFKSMARELSPQGTSTDLEEGNFDPKDVLAVLWLVFVDTVQGLFQSKWGESYRSAPVRTRFIMREETRRQLYSDIQEMDNFMKRRTPMKNWSVGIREEQGLFQFIEECLLK